MGMASRWIMNFLLGKKEKNKSQDTTIAVTERKLSYKRRWRSFGRTSSKAKAKDLATATFYLSTATGVEDNAATKIQAVFRSYLAKKALCALRSLVKLQALVRGNLVRKQTASTLKRMHALMSIQVRARYHRLQMTGEPFSKRPPSSTSENDLSSYFYRDDFSLTTSQTSSNTMITKSISARASFDFDQFSHPNFMADTESSRAKVARSHSEPKQRPLKSKAIANVRLQDGLFTQNLSHLQVQNNALSRFIQKNPTRLSKLLPYTTNSYSSEYEPHISLY